MSSAWAIIPARGGSKGIAGKNLRRVGGRTLLRRAVESCLAAESISRVIVSTDDSDIAKEARACGAVVVDRPPGLSGDTASSELAVLHVLEVLGDGGTPFPEVTLIVQCTSPFTQSSHLNDLVGLLQQHDSAFTAKRSHVFLWRHSDAGSMVGVNHDAARRLHRQQLEPEFAESGNAYAMRTLGFLLHRHRFFGSIGILEIEPRDALEIDDPNDLEVARAVASTRERTGNQVPPGLDQIDAVIFDFDGVLTDDTVVVHQDGTESVTAHRGDGLGISALRNSGVAVLILSKERNPVVAARATKLRVDVIHGCNDKRPATAEWLDRHGIDSSRAIFVGNDINDLEAMKWVGLAACPADARPEVRGSSHWVLKSVGGRGAARELTDALMAARKRAGSAKDTQ